MDFLKVPIIDHRWVLNTPERNGILSEGPPEHVNCNILGKGAYGTVFKAIFRDQPVAIKVVKNRAGVNRTENETHILGWKHRNIVRILKVESTVNFGIIIMERFPGQSLQLISDTMDFPLVHRVLISLDILCALCYCHKRDLLHLDVKPQNVLVAFDNTQQTAIDGGENLAKVTVGRSYICKLCDFGSSMKLSDKKQTKLNAGGTVRYMSPEALRSDILNFAADIYSLGITMWQLKHRRTPYDVIQCNEVVAFQVVKYNLRPDSDLRQFIHNSSEFLSPKYKHKICRCEYYNTEVKCSARKKLQFGAFDMKNLSPRGCYSADKKDSKLSVSISPIPRARKVSKILPFNGLKSASRNLQKELDFTDCKTDSIEFSLNIQKIFHDVSDWDIAIAQQKENDFKNIYQDCWQSSFEKRPSSAELYKRLRAIFK